MRKKLLSCILTVCMMLTLLPVSAFAAAAPSAPEFAANGGVAELVTTEDGSTATFTLSADPGDNVTYKVYPDSDGNKGEEEVNGVTATAETDEDENTTTLTLAFEEGSVPTETTVYHITAVATESGETAESENATTVTVLVAPAAPGIAEDNATAELDLGEEGEQATASFTLTTAPDAEVSYVVYAEDEESKGAKADGITASVEGSTLTLTFTTAPAETTNYYITAAAGDDADGTFIESEAVKVTVTVAAGNDQSAAPQIEIDTVTAEEGNQTATFTLTDPVADAEYKVYTSADAAEEASGITATASDTTLTVTFTTAIDADTELWISAIDGDKEESERTKVTVELYVDLTGTTAAPHFTATTVTLSSADATSVDLTLSTTYTGEVAFKVYTDKETETEATDVTVSVDSSTVTLSWDSAPETDVTYYITATETEDSTEKEESTAVAITVKAYTDAQTYTVTYDPGEGSGTMNAETVAAGEEVTLPECEFEAPENKEFAGWLVGSDETLRDAGAKITVDADITVTASWKAVGSVTPIEYDITIEAGENGTATTSPASSAAAGVKVTITAEPEDGYEVDEISVEDEDGNDVSVNDDGEFTMPASGVTVTVTFKVAPVNESVDLEVTVSNGVAESNVTADQITAAISAATGEDENAEVAVTIDATSDGDEEVTVGQVSLPKAAVEALAEGTERTTIKTDVGDIVVPAEALSAVLTAAANVETIVYKCANTTEDTADGKQTFTVGFFDGDEEIHIQDQHIALTLITTFAAGKKVKVTSWVNDEKDEKDEIGEETVAADHSVTFHISHLSEIEIEEVEEDEEDTGFALTATVQRDTSGKYQGLLTITVADENNVSIAGYSARIQISENKKAKAIFIQDEDNGSITFGVNANADITFALLDEEGKYVTGTAFEMDSVAVGDSYPAE